MADDHFPFVIYGVGEEDIAILFFALVACFDTATLSRFRLVSKSVLSIRVKKVKTVIGMSL